jgi:hypothetical protein
MTIPTIQTMHTTQKTHSVQLEQDGRIIKTPDPDPREGWEEDPDGIVRPNGCVGIVWMESLVSIRGRRFILIETSRLGPLMHGRRIDVRHDNGLAAFHDLAAMFPRKGGEIPRFIQAIPWRRTVPDAVAMWKASLATATVDPYGKQENEGRVDTSDLWPESGHVPNPRGESAKMQGFSFL